MTRRTPFHIGSLVVHRWTTAESFTLFGRNPRAVVAVNEHFVHVEFGDGSTAIPAVLLNFAPGTHVRDDQGTEGVVVREPMPAPQHDDGPLTRVAIGGRREWWITDRTTPANTAPVTVWGCDFGGGAVTWCTDEDSARHLASKDFTRRVVSVTGAPTFEPTLKPAGRFVLVNLDALRAAAMTSQDEALSFADETAHQGDFLDTLEQSLRTPGGTSALIDEYRSQQGPCSDDDDDDDGTDGALVRA